MYLSTRQILQFGTCFGHVRNTLCNGSIVSACRLFSRPDAMANKASLLLSWAFVHRIGTCSYFVTVEELFIVLFDKQMMSALTYSKLVWSERFLPSSNSHLLTLLISQFHLITTITRTYRDRSTWFLPSNGPGTIRGVKTLRTYLTSRITDRRPLPGGS